MPDYTNTATVMAPSGQITYSKQYTASQSVEVDESFADSTTDTQVNLAVDISAVQVFFMACDQDVTVEANDGAGAAGTVSLKANVPYVWTADSYDSIAWTADLTALFITNSSGSTATLKIRCIYDATP